MSNIDKHTLRQHAEHIIELESDEAICHRVLIDAYEKSDRLFTAQNVLALLDELEAAEKRSREMAELLINLKKARPGGVYFNKWDTPVSYTHLTLPTTCNLCRSRWSPYH